MKKYVAEVIRAREECDAAHPKENEAQKQTIRNSDTEDPVICLLDATCWAVRLQAKRAVDAFLNKIKETLHRHVPVIDQGSPIANALSTCMQFQMSIWRMIGDWVHLPPPGETLWLVQTCRHHSSHSQDVPKQLCHHVSPAPVPKASFSSTFQPMSSGDEDDEGGCFGCWSGLRRFDQDSPMPSGNGRGAVGRAPPFSSTPLPHGGHFILASNQTGVPSSTLSTPPPDDDKLAPHPYDEELTGDGDGGRRWRWQWEA